MHNNTYITNEYIASLSAYQAVRRNYLLQCLALGRTTKPAINYCTISEMQGNDMATSSTIMWLVPSGTQEKNTHENTHYLKICKTTICGTEGEKHIWKYWQHENMHNS